MADQDQAYEQILLRVRKLERQNMMIKRFGLLLLFCAGAVFWMAQQPRVSRSVDSRRFTLRDAKGNKRAELAMALNRPVLTFFDETDRVSVSVGVEEDGPGIFLLAPGEKRSASMSIGENGPILSMHERSGAKRLNISVTAQGPTIGLLSPNGEAKAAFGTAGANAYLHLFGSKERGGTQLSASSDRAVLRFFDMTNKTRAVLGTLEQENAPSLTLNDADGVSRAILALAPKGASIDFLDAGRNVVWRAP